jgi:serine/threonine protein kinase
MTSVITKSDSDLSGSAFSQSQDADTEASLLVDSPLDRLSPEQCERLCDILDSYLQSLEQGRPQHIEALIAKHPDLAEAIRLQVKGLQHLHTATVRYPALPSPPNTLASALNLCEAEHSIDGYRIIREIGRGGMGIVYEAYDEKLCRRVAVKLLPLSIASDPISLKRFQNEALTAAQIDHPNIVSVIASGCAGIVPYYIMPLVEGTSLNQLIQNLKVQPQPVTDTSLRSRIELALQIGVQLADALHSAHEIGVVHRDIKPANIIVNRNDMALLTDFGLAKYVKNDTLTSNGDLLGTLKYMSPEQAAGNPRLIDHRSDIYSLSATLIELITLRCVVPDEDHAFVLRQLIDFGPIPLNKLMAGLPTDVVTVLEKGCSYLASDRYQSAAEFREDLCRLQLGRPPLAKPLSRLEHCSRYFAKNANVLISAMAVTLLLSVSFGLLALIAWSETRRAEQNLQKSQENYRSLRQTVDRQANLTDQLRGIPGTENIRSQVAEETLNHYLEFINKSEDAGPFLFDLGRAYCRVGELQIQQGRFDSAFEATQKAIDSLRSSSVGMSPAESSEASRSLAVAYNNLATLWIRKANWKDALLALRIAEDLQVAAIERSSLSSAKRELMRLELAITRQHASYALNAQGKTDEAGQILQDALRLLEQISSPSVTTSDLFRRTKATVARHLAEYSTQHGGSTALELYKVCLIELSEIAREGSLQDRLTLATTHDAYAMACLQSGQVNAALRQSQLAIEMLRLLLSASSEEQFRNHLAKCLANRAAIFMRDKRFELADSDLCESLSLVSARDDSLLCASLLCNRAGVVQEGGKDHDAEKFLQEAWKLCEARFDEQNPLVNKDISTIKTIGNAYAGLLARRGKHALADYVSDRINSLKENDSI